MKKIIYLLMLFVMCLCITGCSTNTIAAKQRGSNKELKVYLECTDYWLKADHDVNLYYFDYDKITNTFWKLHPNATIVDYEFVMSTNTSFWNGGSQIMVIEYYE